MGLIFMLSIHMIIVPVTRYKACLLSRLWFRILPGTWMFVCCECFVLSGRGLCFGLITRPEESYRLCCVVVCDLEISRMRRLWFALSLIAMGIYIYIYIILLAKKNLHRNYKAYETFRGPWIMIFSCKKSQEDALFHKFIFMKNFTCFGQTYCPSSRV